LPHHCYNKSVSSYKWEGCFERLIFLGVFGVLNVRLLGFKRNVR
jgi:hypothetical protein